MNGLRQERPSRWLALARAPLWLLVASVLVPDCWMAIGAFKTVPELVQQPPTFWVQQPTLQNFYDPGWVEGVVDPEHWAGIAQRRSVGHGFGRYDRNSLGVTVFVTAHSLLAAIGIPVALAEWNAFLWPLLVTNDAAHMTLPLQLGKMAGNLTYDPQSAGVLMAASLAVSLPAVLVFLYFQRQFVDGLTAGATKT